MNAKKGLREKNELGSLLTPVLALIPYVLDIHHLSVVDMELSRVGIAYVSHPPPSCACACIVSYLVGSFL
jgi:hypothetical protein